MNQFNKAGIAYFCLYAAAYAKVRQSMWQTNRAVMCVRITTGIQGISCRHIVQQRLQYMRVEDVLPGKGAHDDLPNVSGCMPETGMVQVGSVQIPVCCRVFFGKGCFVYARFGYDGCDELVRYIVCRACADPARVFRNVLIACIFRKITCNSPNW